MDNAILRYISRTEQQEERGAPITRNKEANAEDADDIEDIEEVPALHDDDVSVRKGDLTDVRVETRTSLPPAWYKR